MSETKDFFKKIIRSVGPGFITGAADDDPSGIATYSQTGVMFGLSQLWMVLFTYPFMTVVQEMCGRIGLVTGKGLAQIIRQEYSRTILWGAIALLVVANTINIGADLGAMAASLKLLLNAPEWILLFCVTAFMLGLEIIVPYPQYSKILKYLTLSLLAYIAVAFVIKLNWGAIGLAFVTPHFELSKGYVLNLAAFLGTTISPYLFFWQADEEAEEEVEEGKLRDVGRGKPEVKKSDIVQMRIDTASGMLFSQIITFFIIVAVAATLYASGIHTISTADQAAKALQPIAGNFAFLLFALGIIGTGLLAVPVLAGSAGYAVAEAMQWKEGLGKRFSQAPAFYMVITAATVVGLAVNLTPIPPMTMLYYSAMLNGVLAPPLMIVLLFIANNKKIMGNRTNGKLSNWLGIIITAAMSAVAIGLLWSVL